MSMMGTAVSGMLGDTNWLSTISQNVANANTTGYKNVETEFSALVDQVGGAAVSRRRRHDDAALAQHAAGLGRRHADHDRPRHPGRRLSSSSPTPSGDLYLTRNGSFVPDAYGNLVNSAGYYLMGYNVQDGEPADLEFARRPEEGQRHRFGRGGDADHRRPLAVNLPSTRRGRHAADLPSANTAAVDLHRRNLGRRLRQSRRRAHDQRLFHQHRHERGRRRHLGSRRLRRRRRGRGRRLPLFGGPAGDGRR